MKFFALFALLLLSSTATAAVELKFGPEFTFARHDGAVFKARLISRMKAHLIDGQPDGAKFTQSDFGRTFTSPNGWGFSVEHDNGVIEVKMTPMTVAQYKQFADDIQDAIFVSAYNFEHYPPLFLGGGHINIGIAELHRKPLLLRNLIVDILNHSELFMGVFNYDTHNALPFALFTEDAKRRTVEALKRFESSRNTIDLLYSLENTFSNMADPYYQIWRNTSTWERQKYTALSFVNSRNRGEERLELRGVRPQADIYTWIHQIELIQKRANLLAERTTPLPLENDFPVYAKALQTKSANVRPYLLTPPADPQVLLERFHRYLVEIGEKWEDHRSYLWPAWHTKGVVSKYEASATYRALSATCAQNLVNP